MSRIRIASVLLAAVCLWDAPKSRAGGDENPKAQEAAPSAAPGKLVVTVGKSLIIDSPMKIQRISVANGDLMEAVAVNPKEVLINGKAAGETSLIIWQEGGNRLLYDLTVRLSPVRLDAVRQQLARDFPSENINVTFENDTAFVRGTVKDVVAADRVMAIAASLGKTVNLLRVEVPPVEEQILLKVRFCNVDRGASTDLGVSFASGAFNQSTAISTGQFSSPGVGTNGLVSLSDALNILLFRKDINLAASIKALEEQAYARNPRRAEHSGHQRQGSQLRGRRRVPLPHDSTRAGRQLHQRNLPRVRHPHPLPAPHYAPRHHPAAGRARSQRARLRQRGHHLRHHDPRPQHTAREYRSGTGQRTELRDRRPDGQPDHRKPSTRSRAWRAFRCSANCSPANPRHAPIPNCWSS